MGHSSKDAAARDVQTLLSKEEFALDTGQKSRDAAVKDVQIQLKKEMCA